MEMGIPLTGMMGSDGGNRAGPKPDMRDVDPYYYARVRGGGAGGGVPGAMYRGQQGSGGMMVGQMANQMYMPSGSVGYGSPDRGAKGSPGSGMMMDWYGQMPQIVYNPHLGGTPQDMYDQMALEQMMIQGGGGANMGQRSPYIRPPMPQESSSSSTNVTITIGCLPHNADLALLHDLFSPYGRIISAQIDDSDFGNGVDQNNAHCGRGRIQMSGMAQAQFASGALNGAIIFEGGKPLQVNILGPRRRR